MPKDVKHSTTENPAPHAETRRAGRRLPKRPQLRLVPQPPVAPRPKSSLILEEIVAILEGLTGRPARPVFQLIVGGKGTEA